MLEDLIWQRGFTIGSIWNWQKTYSKEVQDFIEAMTGIRLSDIDRSKGLAIILVVLGHFADWHTTHHVPTWYFAFKSLIYSFHMPFFMFLSGFVISYSSPNISSVKEWGRFIRKKFWRLMPAFLFFGVLVFFGKIAAQKIIYVDNIVQNPLYLFNIIITPMNSPAKYLWYVYILFQICCMYPVLIWFSNRSISCLLALTWLILVFNTYVSLPDFFGLDLLCQMLFFFVYGMWFSKQYEACSSVIDEYFPWFVFAFFTILLLRTFIPVYSIVTAVIAIPACYGIARRWNSRVLSVFGKYCFSIYLMNMIFIGLTKGIILQFFAISEPFYSLMFIVCCVTGLCLPVILKVYVFKYVGWLNRITA